MVVKVVKEHYVATHMMLLLSLKVLQLFSSAVAIFSSVNETNNVVYIHVPFQCCNN